MIHNPKVYADKSPIHGWGVFAKEDIIEGEVFEECPILTLPIEKGEEIFVWYGDVGYWNDGRTHTNVL